MKLKIGQTLLAVSLMYAAGAAQAATFDYMLLAASWQSGFCVSHGDKPECKNLGGTYAASNFVVHGLWPNAYDGDHPFYCGVASSQIELDKAKAWCSMNNYGVSSGALANLSYYMPGVQSCLDKHEWYKHGTCANSSPDAYWNTTSGMVSRLNSTGFAAFVRKNIGKYVTRSQLLSSFSSSVGSTSALALKCTKTNNISYLTEVWINVKQDALNSFPSSSSLLTDGAVQGTCPTSGIFIK